MDSNIYIFPAPDSLDETLSDSTSEPHGSVPSAQTVATPKRSGLPTSGQRRGKRDGFGLKTAESDKVISQDGVWGELHPDAALEVANLSGAVQGKNTVAPHENNTAMLLHDDAAKQTGPKVSPIAFSSAADVQPAGEVGEISADYAAFIASTEFVEVVDEHDRPFMVMPVAQVHSQPLGHRIVLTMLFNNENQIYLQRRSKNKTLYPGMWELSSTGHVMAGESREEAAIREVREELNLNVGNLTERESLAASRETDHAWITLFAGWTAAVPRPNREEVEEGMFVDREELFSMIEHFSELCTPAVLWAAKNGYIFPLEED